MQTSGANIAQRLEVHDLSLFDTVPTQSSDGDRRSWLAVQHSVRCPSGYTYLEIGSFLGGSIQQHLVDPWCSKIISIDKRPHSQPDDRGETLHYGTDNTAACMLDHLLQVAPTELGKVTCYDADAKDLDSRVVPVPPTYCFIDGEHSQTAVLSDFEFCLKVCDPNAAICFHDDWIIYRALASALTLLRRRGVPFTARKLEGQTFGIFLRDCPAASDPYIRRCSQDGGRWIRGRRLRALVPSPARPVVRWVVRRFQSWAAGAMLRNTRGVGAVASAFGSLI